MAAESDLDVAAWLAGLGLAQYAPAFAENHIDGDVLDALTDADLKELGVASLGHRKRLLAAIAQRGVGAAAGIAAGAGRGAGAGTSTGAGTGSPPADAAPRPPAAHVATVESERRQVTILFADLVGFTALSQSIDAEDLHTLVGRYASLVDRIIVAYGGSIDKHIGDAVMALFGAPIAHGDDPLRAARAALDIHAGMEGLAREFGRPLSVHLGVACGEVIAGGLRGSERAEYTVHGDSVNLAARLVALAKPGQTLVSEPVYRAISAYAQLEAHPPATVKGFDRPVAIWSLEGLDTEAATTRTPFVGRRQELEQFAGMLATCEGSGSGQVVYIRGEPGMGKSRLVGEMVHLAEARGFGLLRALVLDFGTAKGHDAIRALVRGVLGLPAHASEDERIAASVKALEEKWVDAEDAVFLDDLLNVPLRTETRALYDAMDASRRNLGKRQTLAALIASAARVRPHLIVVEDIHWADAVTLDLLVAIAVQARRVPALLVLTSRIEGDPLGNAWRASVAGTPFTTLDIGPLRPEEASILANSFVTATNRVALACIERAGGNPLFLEQLLRHAENGATEAVPASIQSLVLARMDLLTSMDKLALQAASVLGQRFEPGALRHLLGNEGYDLAALLAHALVLPDGTTYLFAHSLVREGVYSSLLKARRRDLHLRAALWFQDGDPVLHAQHLDRAEDPGAARAYAAAALAARKSFHGERALELAERGLALAVDEADRFHLTCLRGKLLTDHGATAESIESFREAMALARSDEAHCEAAIGLASSLRIADLLPEALDVLDGAQAAAQRAHSAEDLSRIHHLRGNIYFPLGRIDDCNSEHEAGLRYARESGSDEAEARALGGLGDASYAQGRMHSAFEQFSRCVALAHQHGYGRIEVANRYMVGFSRMFLNQVREALDDGQESVAAAALVGQPRAQLLGEGICMFACYELADWEGAFAHHESGGRIARRLGAKRFEAQYAEVHGRLLRELGREEDGLRWLREAVALCHAAGPQFTGPSAIGGLALATADPVEQQELLDRGEALLRRGAIAHNHFWFYRDAIEAMIDRGEWQGALRYADALEAFSKAAEPVAWTDLVVARARALVGWETGAHDEAARRTLEAVRDESSASGMRRYIDRIDRALAAG